MSVRVHELAKRCGLTSKQMLEKLRAIKYPVKSHSSTVDNISAEAIAKEYGYVPPEEKPVAPPAPAKEEPPPAETPVAEPTPTPAAVPAAPVEAPVPVAKAPAPAPPPGPSPLPPIPAPPVKPAVTTPAAKPPPPPVAPPPPPPKPVAPAAPVEPEYIIDEHGNKVIRMKPPVIVRDLAQRIGTKPHLILMQLMELNVFANLNERLDEDAARQICGRHGFLFELEKRDRTGGPHVVPPPAAPRERKDRPEDEMPRPPVVTFLGHVDHGKTSLLDVIRKTKVVDGETGGITQHIGASVVSLGDKGQIVFLDTPGHEAFTKMRARGANVTDMVVLIVAADDGVMPQTVEALNHAKAAGVTMIVAINKIDLPAANPDRVRRQLQEHGLTPESWGGETIMVEVSATTQQGIDEMLEMLLLQAEVLELRANPQVPARGTVIESQVEPGMGPTATVLVRQGTLRVGQGILCGLHWGKVRALINDQGKRVKEATPAIPVKILGLSGMPEAGAEFSVLANDKDARDQSAQLQLDAKASAGVGRHTTLEEFLSQSEEGKKKTLHLVLKTDMQGSLEAIHDSLGKLESDKVDLQVIHGAAGNINENDVLLASASDAVIIGFRVKPESGVTEMAKHEDVQVRLYSVIYELLDQVQDAMKGLLEPEAREVVSGHAEVRKVFQLSRGVVAGCVVTDGRLTRNSRARLIRRDAVQYEGRLTNLRHFQDDVKDVRAGMECGLRLEQFTGFQEGDVIECYTVEMVPATTT